MDMCRLKCSLIYIKIVFQTYRNWGNVTAKIHTRTGPINSLVLIPNHNAPNGHLRTTGLTFKNFKCCPQRIRLWFLCNLEKIEAPSTDWFYNQTEGFRDNRNWMCKYNWGLFPSSRHGRNLADNTGKEGRIDQVRHWDKTGLNQSLIYTRPFTPLSHQFFYLLILNLEDKKNLR